MIKNLLSIIVASLATLSMAQELVTIYDIQYVPDSVLAACNDSSMYYDDTVRVRGVVTVDGTEGRSHGDNSRNVWIQDGNGPFSGLDIFNFGNETSPTDMRDLVEGDSVEIVGRVGSYYGESEILDVISVSILGTASVPDPVIVDLGEINNEARDNQLLTGEQYEGMVVTFENVTVISVENFASDRYSFAVQDEEGNQIGVSDRFLAQRVPVQGGNFSLPDVGTEYLSLTGILAHSSNGCFGGSGRGYELYPFKESHYKVNSLTNITQSVEIPTSSDDVVITTVFVDPKGIVNPTLFYAVGLENNSYLELLMNAVNDSTYIATIPAQIDGAYVKYYVSKENNGGIVRDVPNVPGGSKPEIYLVRDNMLTIYDVQFTPYSDGNSLLLSKEVVVEGIVTASAESDNLGYIFIQQEGISEWAGVLLGSGGDLVSFKIGDKVKVTGTVEENGGYTMLDEITSTEIMSSGNTINPLILSSTLFTEYDFDMNEKYEGMLITLSEGDEPLEVVELNADAPSNYAEWRVGPDWLNPVLGGTRVLTGRVDGDNAFSSLNVSYINDSSWAETDGIINPELPIKVVVVGDTLTSITGLLMYSHGEFKLLPRNNADVIGYPLPEVEEDTTNTGTGLAEIEDELGLYPNPTTGSVTVDLDEKASVFIYNLTGTLVAVESLSSGNSTLEISSQGTFIVRAITSSGVVYQSTLIVE